VLTGTPRQAQAVVDKARRISIAYVYWLQTECPRDPGDTSGMVGYPELRVCTDIFDTSDGTAPVPYYRESRRILALDTITEQEVAVARHSKVKAARATFMYDSVGLGFYPLDVHFGTVDKGHNRTTRPFQIPLGSLIPIRLTNLLPACKDIGDTHLTNGAYRAHPVEWNIGESAGELAAFCIEHGCAPQHVVQSRTALSMFQRQILDDGIPLYWFTDLLRSSDAFEAVEYLTQRGVIHSDADSLSFHPDDDVSGEDWRAWRRMADGVGPEQFHGTRAQAAKLLFDDLTAPRGVVSLAAAKTSGPVSPRL